MKRPRILSVLFLLLLIFISVIIVTKICIKISGIVNIIKSLIDNLFRKRLSGVSAYSQYPDYPTGCESVSLYILLKYYGIDVTVQNIVDALPKGPSPYSENKIYYGANPEKKFVGNPGNSSSYGVFEKPIADTAEIFRAGAKSKTGADIAEIEDIIDSGNPVLVWCARTEDTKIKYKRSWLDPDTGEKVNWFSGEHALVVYGYTKTKLLVSDPNTGTKHKLNRAIFEKSFNELGGRIVYYEE